MSGGGVGFDVVTHASVRVGFDVMGETMLLLGKETDKEELISALTIGGHVLFGRWGH